MSFGTRSVDPGTSLTLPVAVDTIAGAEYQRVKLADPTADATGAFGVDANPLRVRSRRRGTTDYDSGLVNLPSTETQLFSGTVYLTQLFFHNLTGNIQRLNVRNTAGVYLFKDYDLEPHAIINLQCNEAAIVGLHWQAANANAISGQIVGTQ
jgi:hypothetical protein